MRKGQVTADTNSDCLLQHANPMTTIIPTSKISQDLEVVVSHNPHLLKDKLHFSPSDGSVVLHGSVGSYFEKQLAQEALRNVDGVSEIKNDLTVEWS